MVCNSAGVGEERACRLAARLEGLPARLAQEGVGVVTGREGGHAEPQAGPRKGVGPPAEGPPVGSGGLFEQVLGAARRLRARPVGVEEEDRVVRVAAEEAQVVRGERGAQDGHRVAHPRLVRHHAVDVALDEERPARGAHRVPGQVEGIERLPLLVEGGLR